MFEKKNEARLRAYALKTGAFDSRKTAFDYFFIFEGKSVEEAGQLASGIASARGVPEQPEPAKTTVDKVKEFIRQGTELSAENPKIADFFLGLFSGALTTAFGVKIGSETSGPAHEIDRTEVKEIDYGETDSV